MNPAAMHENSHSVDAEVLGWPHPRLAKSLSMDAFRDLNLRDPLCPSEMGPPEFDFSIPPVHRALSFEDRGNYFYDQRKTFLTTLSTGDSLSGGITDLSNVAFPSFGSPADWGPTSSLEHLFRDLAFTDVPDFPA